MFLEALCFSHKKVVFFPTPLSFSIYFSFFHLFKLTIVFFDLLYIYSKTTNGTEKKNRRPNIDKGDYW
jgi:hypothetical protein